MTGRRRRAGERASRRLLLVLAVALACALPALQPAVASAADARLRIFHAGVPAGPVDLEVDGAVRLRGVLDGTASAYVLVPAGRHRLVLRSSVGGRRPMARLVAVLREGRAHTAAVAGRRGRPRLFLLRDARPPRAARVAVRVVHLLPGAPPLRVRTHASRRGAFVARVRFGTASRYVRVPAAELVRGALGLDLVAPDGRAVARPALGVAPGRAYSLFVTAATGGGSPRLVLAQDS